MATKACRAANATICWCWLRERKAPAPTSSAPGARTGNRRESGLEVRHGASLYHQDVAPKRARSLLCLALLGCELRGVRVEQHGDGGGLRCELMQQLQPLGR